MDNATGTVLLFFGLSVITVTAASSALFSQFQFTQEPIDAIGIRDQQQVLDCSAVYEDASPVILWTKDGVQIDPDVRREVMQNGSLWIREVVHTKSHRPDEGVYQCKALAPELGTIVSRTARLHIAYLSRAFAEEPSSAEVYLGDTAAFRCRIDGAPAPSVRWFKDGESLDIDSSSNFRLHLDGTLEIGIVHFDDFGRYSCRVENVDRARDSAEAALTQNSNIAVYQAGVAPHFVLRPEQQVALEGASVELLCAANGRDESGKPPRLTWLKDGVTIDLQEDDSRYSLLGQGSLRILGALEGDSGLYTCRATNAEDAVDADALVTVHVAPRFQRRPANTVTSVSSDVTFTCDVYGVPPPTMVWMKNGEVIINSNYFQIGDGGRTLHILGLVPTDRGVYQCFAENVAGSVQASAQLLITAETGADSDRGGADFLDNSGASHPADGLSLKLPSQPTRVMTILVSKRFVILSWEAPMSEGTSLVDGYTVYWTEDGSDRRRMLNTSSLEANIQGLEPATRYTFRVVAHNRAGAGPPATVQATTEDEVNVPSPARELLALPLSSTSIRVTWAAPAQLAASVTHYVVSYYPEGGTEQQSPEVTLPGYTLQGLEQFVLYTVYVVAYNVNGAGEATHEVTAKTFSDVPTAAPQNVTVESVSSTALVVRWQPPPSEDRNGLITGYKIRYKKDGDRKGMAVTEDSTQRSYSLNDLERGASYQIRLQALNVNGSGPPTDWLTAMTYAFDLDESTVPGQPLSLDVRPMIDSIVVAWIPPANRDIRVRGYVLGYGEGIPDVYRIVLDHNLRFYTIKNLSPGVSYVISLRAYNNMGEGRERLATTITRSEQTLEPQTPMMPPVGLKAITLSSSAIIVTWSDTALGRSQRVTDGRFYTIRYGPAAAASGSGGAGRLKYINCTELNQHIDGLRPNTEYEFSVMVTKAKRNSPYSLSSYNRTFESLPATPPRDLTPAGVPGHPDWVMLSWQPPRNPNGQITGYLVLYTADPGLKDRDWVVEGITRGDQLSTTVRALSLDTTYYFKVHARNNKGNSPMSPTVIYRTPKTDGTGGGRVEVPDDYGRTNQQDNPGYKSDPGFDLDKLLRNEKDHNQQGAGSGLGLPPVVMFASAAVVGGVVLISAAVVIAVLCRRRRHAAAKRGYQAAASKAGSTPTVKPPDLWIHHEQVELKTLERNRVAAEADTEEMKPLNSEYSGIEPFMDARRNSFLSDRAYDDRYHRTPHRSKPITISLEHQPPPPQHLANGGHILVDEDGLPVLPLAMRPLYQRAQYSGPHQYASNPRVVAAPPDFSQPTSEDSFSSATMERNRQNKIGRCIVKPHGSTSMLAGRFTPEYGHYYSEPYRVYLAPPGLCKPPGLSSAAYTRPNPPLTSSTSTVGGASTCSAVSPPLSSPPPLLTSLRASPRTPLLATPTSHSSATPPLAGAITSAPPPDVTLGADNELDKPKSLSTEELSVEMANLEGLMKDLSYITQQNFEC